jgi:hypothetical protein
VPFLRLTRDRRGFENTFLLHANRAGERPRLLYWYRTAPGIVLGRAALDEDAIRTIEEQHPDIDFDWPAILALSEAMMPEEELAPRPQARAARKPRGRDPQREPGRREPARTAPARADGTGGREPAAGLDEVSATAPDPDEVSSPAEAGFGGDAGEALVRMAAVEMTPEAVAEAMVDEITLGRDDQEEERPAAPRPTYGLLEELVGREIAARLRARHAEISARIHERHADAPLRDAWIARAEPLNPDTWLTPAAILDGVRKADAQYDALREELLGS